MKKYLKIYKLVIEMSLMRAMAYPDDFITWIVVDLLWAIINIGFFRILLLAIPQMSGWTFEMLAIPLGLLYLLNAVIWGLFWGSLRDIPADINRGKIDLYLTKPTNSQFLISARSFSITIIPSVMSGIFLIWYGFVSNNLGLSALFIIPVALFSSSIIAYSIWFITITCAFWFNRLLNIQLVFPHSVDVARYPVAIFHPSIQFIFTYIIPFAMLGFLPAEVMLGRKTPIQLLLPMILAVFLLYLSHKFWNFSLRRYSSASS